ncbi:FKBP-type peptidyl-prolyl cis-trans isomerase [Candidatus Vondammii sp. HM_W22]|uniref:FKBP-type peptidyl-prolyl cis-trans isomerase n=1 Tax=Candidatus Vondammii sp. HM_W22 TaxID=2687299 RepID=UPI001F1479AC|nr:FKBP-type peptidyl-prolyl cis-trans isomerase [Candidatus Vondammii sp. HM_W22]
MTKQVIKPGKFVSLTYTITDSDGNLMEQNDIPVSYIHGGETELIGGMDKAIVGKGVGVTVEVVVPPEDGLGVHDPRLIFTDDLENVPSQFRQIGAEVPMQGPGGETKTFYVTKIEDGKLMVDGNHPLVGKTLKIRVKILEVRDVTPEDMPPAAGSCSIN